MKADEGCRVHYGTKEVPSTIQEGHVLVKIDFASLIHSDTKALDQGTRIGYGFSGFVKKIGKNVKEIRSDDLVYGWYNGEWGAVAEYVIAPVTQVAKIPLGIQEETGSALPVLAAWGIHADNNIKKDQKIFIQSQSRMLKALIEAYAKEKEAIILDATYQGPIDLYYHFGGALTSYEDATAGVSWCEARGNIKKLEMQLEENFQVYKEFIEKNVKFLKSLKPAAVISKRRMLDKAVTEIYYGLAQLVVIYTNVLWSIEDEDKSTVNQNRSLNESISSNVSKYS